MSARRSAPSKAEVSRERPGTPASRLKRRNYMTFPTELRNAIPDLPTYVGRTLELTNMRGDASNTPLFGARVHLGVGVQEAGKLKGRYTVRIDLEVEAARGLAANLLELADRAGKLRAAAVSPVKVVKRKR